MFYIKTLLELIQNVEIEMPTESETFRMMQSCKLQLATLYLQEEILAPNGIMEWIIAGCKKMPLLNPTKTEFTLWDLITLKQEAVCILSPRFDSARGCPTKEQPTAYAPPHRRLSLERKWRSIGTQTTAFELMDWVQFQQFKRKGTQIIDQ